MTQDTIKETAGQTPKTTAGWRKYAIIGGIAAAIAGTSGIALAVDNQMQPNGNGFAMGPQDGSGMGPRDGSGMGMQRDGRPGMERQGMGKHGMERHAMGGHGGGMMKQARGGGHHGGGFGARGLERMLDKIDATDEQADKLWEIAGEIRGEMWPMGREFRQTREDLAELLTAETVDAEAVEALRSERIAAIDEMSKTMTAAMVEAAEVLTPEQRAELAKHFEERGPKRRW